MPLAVAVLAWPRGVVELVGYVVVDVVDDQVRVAPVAKPDTGPFWLSPSSTALAGIGAGLQVALEA